MKISNKTNKQNDVWSKTITDGESDKKINIDNLKMFRLLGGDVPEDGILTSTLANALIVDGHAEIPYGYTTIGSNAFQSTDLISVTIPDSVTTIGNSAFGNCTSLTSVTIGNSVTTIVDYAFANCTSLTSVTIGNSVTTILDYAFAGTSLRNVFIPNSVTTIGYYAFSYCYNLKTITFFDGINFNNVGTIIAECDALKLITVYYTDNRPTFLDEYTSDSNGVYTLANSPDTIVNYQQIDTDISGTEFNDPNDLIVDGHAEIPYGYTSIGDTAFAGMDSLTSVTIPDSVTTIGVGAFDSCSGLTSVTIPNSVTSIGVGAFNSCTALTSVIIGNSVIIIGDSAFNETSLTSVIIPNSVTTIGDGAFEGCDELTSVIMYEDITSFGSDVFESTSLSEVTVYYTDNQPNYDDFLPIDFIYYGVVTYRQIGGSTTINLTFEVDARHITVGPNGLYIGVGIFGGANAVALSDDDGDGIWSATVSSDQYNIASGGYYNIFNNPSASNDWTTKEDISGQYCADANNYNERILPPITEDTTINLTFGKCCTDDLTGYGHGLCPETTDSTAPVITLNGESTVKIILGEEYIDSGASASDYTDNDLTSSIITVNNVDTSKVGTYYVTYNVNDAAGNVAIEVTRTVIVTLDQNDDDEVNVLDIVAAFNNGNKHLIPSIVDTILGR